MSDVSGTSTTRQRLGVISAMVEKNWGTLTLALSEVQIEPRHGGEKECTPGAELPDRRWGGEELGGSPAAPQDSLPGGHMAN